MSSFINTDPLKKVATAARTEDEAYLCRFLANSISDGSPFAWKMFYSGEASEKLSKDSCEALEKVMEDAEKMFNTPPCRSPLPRLAKANSAIQKTNQGITIREPKTEKGKEKKTPVVGKGKSKVFEKPTEITYGAIENPKLPWEGVYIGSGALEDPSKTHNMYIEGIDGQFYLAKVCKKDYSYPAFNYYADNSSATEDYDEETSNNDEDSDVHCFICRQEG